MFRQRLGSLGFLGVGRHKVGRVVVDGLAYRSGIRFGDTLTAINGAPPLNTRPGPPNRAAWPYFFALLASEATYHDSPALELMQCGTMLIVGVKLGKRELEHIRQLLGNAGKSFTVTILRDATKAPPAAAHAAETKRPAGSAEIEEEAESTAEAGDKALSVEKLAEDGAPPL